MDNPPESVELLFTGHAPGSRRANPIVNRTTVSNSPTDLQCLRRLEHLDELQHKAPAINTRLLDTESVGQDCVLASPAFERVASPTVNADGRRAPAMLFGDPQVMALLGALCVSLNILGFTQRSLRALVKPTMDGNCSTNQMSYDLARLTANGLVQPRAHSNSYTLTANGQRVAFFRAKVHDRLLCPLIAADLPPAPIELRTALETTDRHVNNYITAVEMIAV